MFNELNEIKLFFEYPVREFHLREISRILKKNPVTVKSHLSKFVKKEVIIRKKERNLELYCANTENFYYKEYKRIYNIFRIFESGLVDYIKENLEMPTIVFFGSYERGEDNTNSDIDLFILSESKKTLHLDQFEKKLAKPIQLHIFNKKDFEKLMKNNKDLFNSIINGSILSGFLEVM